MISLFELIIDVCKWSRCLSASCCSCFPVTRLHGYFRCGSVCLDTAASSSKFSQFSLFFFFPSWVQAAGNKTWSHMNMTNNWWTVYSPELPAHNHRLWFLSRTRTWILHKELFCSSQGSFLRKTPADLNTTRTLYFYFLMRSSSNILVSVFTAEKSQTLVGHRNLHQQFEPSVKLTFNFILFYLWRLKQKMWDDVLEIQGFLTATNSEHTHTQTHRSLTQSILSPWFPSVTLAISCPAVIRGSLARWARRRRRPLTWMLAPDRCHGGRRRGSSSSRNMSWIDASRGQTVL